MALFGKEKKLTLDDILKAVDELTPEEKERVKAKMEDLDKAEDEREIDKIEEEKADDGEDKDDKETAKDEESEEIGKDVDEVENEIETDVEDKAEDGAKDVADGEIEKHEEDDKDWRAALESRIASLEEAIKGLARNPKETDEKTSSRLEELAKKYD